MEIAQAWAKRSTCSRAHVGTVIAVGGRVVVHGYNGVPAGLPHCDHTCFCNGSGVPARLVPIDGHLPDCPAGGGCKEAVHAEANAIAWAARVGVPVLTGTLFTTMAPCLPCSQLIVNAGILEVVYLDPYRDDSGLALLRRAGVTVWPATILG